MEEEKTEQEKKKNQEEKKRYWKEKDELSEGKLQAYLEEQARLKKKKKPNQS